MSSRPLKGSEWIKSSGGSSQVSHSLIGGNIGPDLNSTSVKMSLSHFLPEITSVDNNSRVEVTQTIAPMQPAMHQQLTRRVYAVRSNCPIANPPDLEWLSRMYGAPVHTSCLSCHPELWQIYIADVGVIFDNRPASKALVVYIHPIPISYRDTFDKLINSAYVIQEEVTRSCPAITPIPRPAKPYGQWLHRFLEVVVSYTDPDDIYGIPLTMQIRVNPGYYRHRARLKLNVTMYNSLSQISRADPDTIANKRQIINSSSNVTRIMSSNPDTISVYDPSVPIFNEISSDNKRCWSLESGNGVAVALTPPLTLTNLQRHQQQFESSPAVDLETTSLNSQGSTLSTTLHECLPSFEFWIGERWNTDASDTEIVKSKMLFDDYTQFCKKHVSYMREIKARIVTSDREFGKLLNHQYPGRRLSNRKYGTQYSGFRCENISNL